LKRRFGVELHERSVGRILNALGYRRLSARPHHPKADEEAQETFKRRLRPKNVSDIVAQRLPDTARGKPLEVWFQDGARIAQQGALTRIWARRGTRPRAPRDQRYIWAYIFGAACATRKVAAALVLPQADAEAISMHLAEISKVVAPGAHAALVLDGAGYHVAAALDIPANITLIPLPPYSPDFNPMENVRADLRANKLAVSVFDDYDDIVERSCKAGRFFADDPDRIAARKWETVTH